MMISLYYLSIRVMMNENLFYSHEKILEIHQK